MSPVIWRVDRKQLLEPFASDVNDLLMEDEGTWVVTCGYRTPAAQAVLFAAYQKGGPLAAPPGESAHNARLGVDITHVQDGKDDWDYQSPAWRRLVRKIHMHPRLHSLDDYGDTDHIEAVNWRRIASLSPRASA